MNEPQETPKTINSRRLWIAERSNWFLPTGVMMVMFMTERGTIRPTTGLLLGILAVCWLCVNNVLIRRNRHAVKTRETMDAGPEKEPEKE